MFFMTLTRPALWMDRILSTLVQNLVVIMQEISLEIFLCLPSQWLLLKLNLYFNKDLGS